jgi:fumarate reductase iron-sulfur subunit
LADKNHISVSVWRGGATGSFQDFKVKLEDNQTVLDVVAWIQAYADPTLDLPHSRKQSTGGW